MWLWLFSIFFPFHHCLILLNRNSVVLRNVLRTLSDIYDGANTAQKMKFSIKDFFSKFDQIYCFLRIWSHSLKKSLTINFFCAAFDWKKLFQDFWKGTKYASSCSGTQHLWSSASCWLGEGMEFFFVKFHNANKNIHPKVFWKTTVLMKIGIFTRKQQ